MTKRKLAHPLRRLEERVAEDLGRHHEEPRVRVHRDVARHDPDLGAVPRPEVAVLLVSTAP